jgi:predicted O-methyltransferase YrrM
MPDFTVGRRWAALLVTRPVEFLDRIQKQRALSRGMKSLQDDASGWSRGLDVIGAAADWLHRLHNHLKWSWPCPETHYFRACWADIEHHLAPVDPTRPNHDADPVLAQSLWCAVRHLQPTSVVETGVSRGVTSRILLEALASNGGGCLWSIDLPPLQEPWFSQSRSAVPDDLRDGWRYVRGSARRVLPRLLRRLETIDLFVHDSLHTYDHMAFEFRLARAHLSATGLIVSDDINTNRAFTELVQSDPTLDGIAITQKHKQRTAVGIAWQTGSQP